MKWVIPRPHAAPTVSRELPDRTLILGGALSAGGGARESRRSSVSTCR
jgi:hypothetical protein